MKNLLLLLLATTLLSCCTITTESKDEKDSTVSYVKNKDIEYTILSIGTHHYIRFERGERERDVRTYLHYEDCPNPKHLILPAAPGSNTNDFFQDSLEIERTVNYEKN